MYKNSNYRNYKDHLFLIASVKSSWILCMDGAKTECKNQNQSTILNLRMQLKNICLCKDLKSQNITEIVFISGSR